MQEVRGLIQQCVILPDELPADQQGAWLLHHHFFGTQFRLLQNNQEKTGIKKREMTLSNINSVHNEATPSTSGYPEERLAPILQTSLLAKFSFTEFSVLTQDKDYHTDKATVPYIRRTNNSMSYFINNRGEILLSPTPFRLGVTALRLPWSSGARMRVTTLLRPGLRVVTFPSQTQRLSPLRRTPLASFSKNFNM